ncbi:MAG: arylamine N-acetyltransferase family protein [Terriglobales bacterium]
MTEGVCTIAPWHLFFERSATERPPLPVLAAMMDCCIPTEIKLDDQLAQRYLGLLRLAAKQPDRVALSELVAAHLMRVPFENISKLHRKRQGFAGVPDARTFLDGMEQYHFGGTCYANNFHLYTLLASLGYEVKLCAADMANPDVHMVIMVSIDGREYLVDAGYGAPFLSPLPRDLRDDYVVGLGRDRYVLKPQDANGCSRLELYRGGALKHGYVAKPAPRRIEDFAEVIADSFRPAATFFNAVLLTRFYPKSSVVIHNLELIESDGTGSRVSRLKDRQNLAAAIEEYFGIPRPIVNEALTGLGDLADAWK